MTIHTMSFWPHSGTQLKSSYNTNNSFWLLQVPTAIYTSADIIQAKISTFPKYLLGNDMHDMFQKQEFAYK